MEDLRPAFAVVLALCLVLVLLAYALGAEAGAAAAFRRASGAPSQASHKQES